MTDEEMHVEWTGRWEMHGKLQSERLSETDHYEDLRGGFDYDNIKMDVKGMGCESVDWFHVIQNRVHWQVLPRTQEWTDTAMNLATANVQP
jgi:hypothetical protein